MYMNCNQHHCVKTQLYYLQRVVSNGPTSPDQGWDFSVLGTVQVNKKSEPVLSNWYTDGFFSSS